MLPPLRRAQASLLLVALGTFTNSVTGGVFSNTDGIAIPDSGTATPYPSLLTISGEGPQLTDITVSLGGLDHTWTVDIGVVLQSPAGDSVALIGRAGGSTDSSVNLTFSDAASTSLPVMGPDPVTSGTYKPTVASIGFSFADAPGHTKPTTWTTTLSTFNGTDPNGVWKLWVQDFAGGDQGSIGSWSVNVSSVPEPSEYAAAGALGLLTFAVVRRWRARR